MAEKEKATQSDTGWVSNAHAPIKDTTDPGWDGYVGYIVPGWMPTISDDVDMDTLIRAVFEGIIHDG